MAVKVGSARIDENGRAHGGKAGDQTGKELSVQSWYRHSKAGDTFNYVATAANGWNAIEVDGQVGWVSGRYSKII